MKKLEMFIRKGLFVFTVLSTFALTGCSSDDAETPQGKGSQIKFSTNVSNLKSGSIGLQIPKDQGVGVFISENGGVPTTIYQPNLQYTADGNGNLSGGVQQFPDNASGIRVSAYHPYSAVANDTYDFSVMQDQYSATNTYASDLLFCPEFAQAPTTEMIPLSFKHQLSLITYTLTSGEGNPDLVAAVVSAVNVATTIMFDRKTGDLSSPSNPTEVLFGEEGGIVVPQTISAGTPLLKIRLASGKEVFYTLDNQLTLETGKKYTFNLRVNMNNATTINTETRVEDWVDGLIIDGEVGGSKLRTDIKLGAYFFGAWWQDSDHVDGNSIMRTDFPERESELGWYNCKSPADISTQIGWAVESGISFFLFDWYHSRQAHYSNIKHNNALNYFKDVNNNRMKYCIVAVNEVGTNTYAYTPDVWNEARKFWISELSNPREDYLRVDGKPLLIIYNGAELINTLGGGSMNNVKAYINNLRQEIKNNGGGDILIGVCNSDIGDAYQCGFDILTQYNLHKEAYRSAGLLDNDRYKNNPIELDPAHLIAGDNYWADNSFVAKWNDPRYPHLNQMKYIPLATTGWDNRSVAWGGNRKDERSKYAYFKFSEETVYRSVYNLTKWIDAHHGQAYTTSEKIGFVYAWNEYNEGAWMLPSKDGKLKPLNGVKRALAIK